MRKLKKRRAQPRKSKPVEMPAAPVLIAEPVSEPPAPVEPVAVPQKPKRHPIGWYIGIGCAVVLAAWFATEFSMMIWPWLH